MVRHEMQKSIFKRSGFRRRKYGRGNLQVKTYANGNKVYLGGKTKGGHGIFTSVLKAFGEPPANFFFGILKMR